MKIFAIRRTNATEVRTWSRDAALIALTTVVVSGEVTSTVQLDLNEIQQIADSQKNAYTLWSTRLGKNKKLTHVNVFAQTYTDKTPAKQFLSSELSYAVLVVPTSSDAILGISVSETDDVSMLGLDGELSVQEWANLVATAYPEVALQGLETSDGVALTATVTKGGEPYSMQGVELYWETTAGALSRARTAIDGNTATNVVRGMMPGSKVKVGFRFFTGAAEFTA